MVAVFVAVVASHTTQVLFSVTPNLRCSALTLPLCLLHASQGSVCIVLIHMCCSVVVAFILTLRYIT
jgi:hypothetical protein